jgi:hypothetical protein
MTKFEVYLKDIEREGEYEFKDKICPFMSGISPRNDGSEWKGIQCLKGACVAWVTQCGKSTCKHFRMCGDTGCPFNGEHCRRLE